jgi:hypothetical protein
VPLLANNRIDAYKIRPGQAGGRIETNEEKIAIRGVKQLCRLVKIVSPHQTP